MAANSIAIGAPSEARSNAARLLPEASITAHVVHAGFEAGKVMGIDLVDRPCRAVEQDQSRERRKPQATASPRLPSDQVEIKPGGKIERPWPTT